MVYTLELVVTTQTTIDFQHHFFLKPKVWFSVRLYLCIFLYWFVLAGESELEIKLKSLISSLHLKEIV